MRLRSEGGSILRPLLLVGAINPVLCEAQAPSRTIGIDPERMEHVIPCDRTSGSAGFPMIAVSSGGDFAVLWQGTGMLRIERANKASLAEIEVARARRIQWVDDSLAVTTHSPPAVRWLGADGSTLGVDVLGSPRVPPGLRAGEPVLLGGDRTAVYLPSFPARIVAGGQIASRPVIVTPIEGGDSEELATLEVGHDVLELPKRDGGVRYTGQPFGDDPLFAVDARTGAVAVLRSRPDQATTSHSVAVISTTGDTIGAFSSSIRRRPLDGGALSDTLRSLMERLDPEAFDLSEADLSSLVYAPGSVGAAAQMVLPGDGRVWVRIEEEGGTTNLWELTGYSEVGPTLLVRLPTGFRPSGASGSHLFGVLEVNGTFCVVRVPAPAKSADWPRP